MTYANAVQHDARTRLTWRTLVWASLALVAWIFILRFPFYYTSMLPDEGLFLTASNEWLHGAHLYRDVWDNKPPGIFVVYALIVLLFGTTWASMHIAAGLTILATSMLTGLLALEISGHRRAGLIAAFVLPAYTLDLGGDGANAEMFMMPLQALAALLLVRQARRGLGGGALAAAVAFGLLEGLLLELKFPVIFETALLGFWLVVAAWRNGATRAAIVRFVTIAALAWAAVPAAVFLLFWLNGGLDALIYSNFISPRLYVMSPFGLADPVGTVVLIARRCSYFMLPILGGLVFLARAHRFLRRPENAGYLLPIAWAIGTVLAASSSGYFRFYYFLALTPPLTLLGALALDWLLGERFGRIPTIAVTALAALALASYPVEEDLRKLPHSLFSEEYRVQQAALRYLEALPAPRSAFIADLSPALYAISGAKPATHYPQSVAHVFDIPDRFGVDPVKELQFVFDQHPLMVMGTPKHLGPSDPYAGIIDPLLAKDYEKVTPGDPWLADRLLMWRRKS